MLTILFKLISGSAFKVKKQENLTDFILDVNETIVSVITGMNSLFSSVIKDVISSSSCVTNKHTVDEQNRKKLVGSVTCKLSCTS